jgi:hypothetical protein
VEIRSKENPASKTFLLSSPKSLGLRGVQKWVACDGGRKEHIWVDAGLIRQPDDRLAFTRQLQLSAENVLRSTTYL